nr:MAG TPA: hypothetical protein [Caudoviricetes sp.]
MCPKKRTKRQSHFQNCLSLIFYHPLFQKHLQP